MSDSGKHQLLLNNFTYYYTCGFKGVKFPLKSFGKALSLSFSHPALQPNRSDKLLVKQKSLVLSIFICF